LLQSGQVSGIIQIGRQGLHITSGFCGKFLREIIHAFPVSRDQEQVVAAAREAIGLDGANS
jgi:hypothetical protein